MPDGKPTVSQIAEASELGELKGRWGERHYEIIKYHGVDILIRRKALLSAIEVTHEWTHDPDVEKLAKELGIKLRKFR